MFAIPRRVQIFILFFCCLIIFTIGLGSEEIIGFDSRFYLFALEMQSNGLSWFPTTYHHPYPDYLGTSTAFIYLFSKIFGDLNKWIAVLPTALFASLTLVFTYLIGELHHKRWGLFAVFFALMTVTFLQSARSISLDMAVTFVTTASFYLVHSAAMKNKKVHGVVLFFLLFVGFIFRGPIGLVIPAGVVCIYYLLDKSIKKMILFGVFALFLLILCFCALLLFAYQTGGMVFLHDVLRMEVLGRMNDAFLPRYFYFTNSLSNYALSFPLMWLVMGGVFYYAVTSKQYSEDIRCLIKLFGWIMVILIGMSLPGDKKTRYILPMVPAAALSVAYLFVAPQQQRYFIFLRHWLKNIFYVAPFLFLVLLFVVFAYARQQAIHLEIPYFSVALSLMVLQFMNFYGRSRHDAWIFGMATLGFILMYIQLVEPIEIMIDKSRTFVIQVEAWRAQHHAKLVFYKEKPDGLPIKYLINMPQQEQPLFIDDQEEIQKMAGAFVFVTSEAYFHALSANTMKQVTLIAKNKLGHEPVVVFVK